MMLTCKQEYKQTMLLSSRAIFQNNIYRFLNAHFINVDFTMCKIPFASIITIFKTVTNIKGHPNELDNTHFSRVGNTIAMVILLRTCF